MTTTEPITHGDTGRGSGEVPSARGRVRLRGGAVEQAKPRFPLPLSHITDRDRWSAAAQRLVEVRPYTDRPASIRDVVAYTRAGGWVPGEHPWWVEAPGHVYGWVVAVPVTVGLYAVAWVLQRPSRLLVFLLVAGLLWLAW